MLIAINGIFGVNVLYFAYQMLRNHMISKIRLRWIDTKDDRYAKYTYFGMFFPSPDNDFGLQWPRDSLYK